MRTYLTLLILILSLASPSSAQIETERSHPDFIGPVRTIRLETAAVTSVSGTPVEGSRVLVQLSSFDEMGNATGRSRFNPDGSLKWKLGWVTSYDAGGRETEIVFLNADGAPTSKSASAYDEMGRKVGMTFFNPDGSINHIQTFARDGNGKVAQEVHRNPNGTTRNTSNYTYDNRGRLTEWSLCKPDGKLTQRNVFTYDDNGRETGLAVYRGDGAQVIGESRSYDERGNVTVLLRHGNGVIFSRETFTYEFDARRNWIKRHIVREVLKGGNSRVEMEVNYRTITYY